MKKRKTFGGFVLVLAVLWIVSDCVLTYTDSLKYSPYFEKNDFEITQLAHPEKVWDKVFFGSSVVIAAYREELSDSGFYNAGVDYGTVSDIYTMLKKGKIKIGDELVLGLNGISFLDSLDTNPTYIWHKKWYQHYIFFERDKIYPLFEKGLEHLIHAEPVLDEPLWTTQGKVLYHDAQTDEELQASIDSMLERFGALTTDDCKKNFADFERLIALCRKKGIRLRAVWMPWNPKAPVCDFVREVTEKADGIMESEGIEVYDMTDMLGPQHFYDTGHVSYENGSEYFTSLLDEFLMD